MNQPNLAIKTFRTLPQLLLGFGQAFIVLCVLIFLIVSFIRLEMRSEVRSQNDRALRGRAVAVPNQSVPFLFADDWLDPSLAAIQMPNASTQYKLAAAFHEIKSEQDHEEWYAKVRGLGNQSTAMAPSLRRCLYLEFLNSRVPKEDTTMLLDRFLSMTEIVKVAAKLPTDSPYITTILLWLTKTNGANGSFSVQTVRMPDGTKRNVQVRIGSEMLLPILRNLQSDAVNGQAAKEAMAMIDPLNATKAIQQNEIAADAFQLTNPAELSRLLELDPNTEPVKKYVAGMIANVRLGKLPLTPAAMVAARWVNYPLKSAIVERLETQIDQKKLTVDQVQEVLMELVEPFADARLAELFVKTLDTLSVDSGKLSTKDIGSLNIASAKLMSCSPTLLGERIIGSSVVSAILRNGLSQRCVSLSTEVLSAVKDSLFSIDSTNQLLCTEWLERETLAENVRDQLRQLVQPALKDATVQQFSTCLCAVRIAASIADCRTLSRDLEDAFRLFEKNPAAAELWIALLLPRFPGQVLTALALNETKISPPMSDAAYWQPTANWDRSQWKLPFWNQPDSWLLLDRAVASEVLARPKLLSDGFTDKNLEWGSTRTIAALRVIENELGASERLSTAMRSIERRMNTLRSVEENR